MPVASLTGILLAGRRLAGMVMTPIAGLLLERFGDRRVVAAAGVLVILAGFVVLVAVGEGFSQPALVVWTGDGAPPHLRGVVMGGLSTAGDFGAALGPLVGYALLETAGLGSAYALCAALTVSALLVLALVRGAAPVVQRA